MISDAASGALVRKTVAHRLSSLLRGIHGGRHRQCSYTRRYAQLLTSPKTPP
jgi:hypothetical protein